MVCLLCGDLSIFCLLAIPRDLSVHVRLLCVGVSAVSLSLFLSVLQAVLSFFVLKNSLDSSSLAEYRSILLFYISIHSFTSESCDSSPFLSESCTHLLSTLQKNSEICLPLLSTDANLASWDLVLKLPFLPHLDLN